MYLTPHQKRQLRIVLVLVIGIPLSIFGVYKGIQYLTNAGVEATPKDVILSNLTTNSLTISWITDKQTDGYVVPILNDKEQSPVRDKRGSGNRYTHYIELKSLEPNTKYTFQIVSDGKKYSDSNGENYEFTTANVSTDTPIPNPVHGSVTGISSNDVVIYVTLKNKSTYPVSAVVPDGGNWLIDLSSFRKISDKSLLKITEDTELVLIAKSGDNKGVSVEGAYSALFDSDGKLNQIYSLEVSEGEDVMTYFPEEVKLGVKDVVVEKPTNSDNGDSDNDTDNNIDNDNDQDDKEEPTPDEQPNTDTDNFTIRKDLQWINIATGSDEINADSGESTILITNLTDTGFNVVWRSKTSEEGYIKYGEEKTSIEDTASDIRDGLTSRNKYYSHTIEITRLTPETTYYFEVHSGTEIYDNSDKYYTVTTLPTLSSPPPFETRSGDLKDISNPSDWVLVARLMDIDETGTSGNSKYISTMPDENGNWILTVGDTRSEDGLEYFTYSSADKIEFFVLGDMTKKYTFSATQTDISITPSGVGDTISQKIPLLSEYGIQSTK